MSCGMHSPKRLRRSKLCFWNVQVSAKKKEFVTLGLCQSVGVSKNVLHRSVKLVGYVLCA